MSKPIVLDARELLRRAAAAQSEVPRLGAPPDEGTSPLTERVFALSLVRNTKYYIEKIANQINGCYERGWFDACAVMIRRLLETLLIEVYEAHDIADKIKNADGDYFQLKELVNTAVNESAFTLGRSTKRALPKLREMGNQSAHSRRYIAHVRDIDDHRNDLRIVIQELVLLAGLKKGAS